ncbi:DUF1304 domain-containing protein [Collinsella vaginalis]|uniref:DUF1304 domain-containing protein n=1 Tax=Collinsella vaginalis TaxID=1870987 RepID=UPI001FEC43D8|nr:DUF1304 domain-containing protein [Collinsella vaginalis]
MDLIAGIAFLVRAVGMIFVAAAALLHVFIAGVEMFGWTGSLARRLFNLEPAFARQTREMAANQGLYNLMLAIEMIVGLGAAITGADWGLKLALAGAVSTVIAGAFLFVTSPDKRSSALKQLTPGLIGSILLILGGL